MKHMWDKCYEMELGSTRDSRNCKERITRVPGGWVLRCYDNDGVTNTFIPFSDEFISSQI